MLISKQTNMKNIFKNILVFTLLFSCTGLISCKKYIGGDTNIDPNKASTPTLNTLLPVAIVSTSENHYRIAYITSLFSEQLGAYATGPIVEDQNRDVRIDGAYQGIYQNSLTNIDAMIKLGVTQNAPYYVGIGKVLMAVNLGLATDTWGDIPYSEALLAPANLYPKYDSQQSIYVAIQSLLDDAIIQLSTTGGAIKPGTDDLVYGATAGTQIANWVKTAWVLKARYAMHLTKKDKITAATNALNYLSKGFVSNAEDCQVNYNSKNLNPWNRGVAVVLVGAVSTVAPTQRFIDLMTGAFYPGVVDSRLPIMMDNKGAATFTGMINGAATASNSNLTANTYYAKDVSPILIVTYAEQKFLEAEAEFIKAGGTISSTGSSLNAYNAYMAGINASMDKLGAVKASYIINPLVAVTPVALRLENIMKEKQIAMFLQPETWVDVRRYDYDATLFRGIALPQNQAAIMGGQFIRRALYPQAEVSTNPNASAAQKTLTTKVWWDQ